jgi:hypothetical protein
MLELGLQLENYYTIECHDADGNLMWIDGFANLITRVGAGDSLTQHLKGSAYTAAWFVGLTGATPVFATADTMATHAGWTDSTAYSNATRPAWTGGTVDTSTDTCTVDNSAAKAVFNINATATIGGAFLVNNSTKGGTTGVIYGGGAFAGGNRSVLSGDTLSVSVSATALAA